MQSRFRVTWQHFKLLLMWPVAFMHGSKASGSRREVRVRKEILLEKDFHKLYMSRPQVTFWSWQFLPNWRLGAGRDL